MRTIIIIFLFFVCDSLYAQSADAGKDIIVNLNKINYVTLDGSNSAGNSFKWEEISTDFSSGGLITSPYTKATNVTGMAKQGTFYFRLGVTIGNTTKYDTVIIRCTVVDAPDRATLQSTMIFTDMTDLNIRDDTVNYYLPWSTDPLAHNRVGISPNNFWTYRDRQTGAYIDSARGKLYNIIQDGYHATNALYARAEMQVNDNVQNNYDSNKVYVFDWQGYFRDDPAIADPSKAYTAIFQMHGRNEVSPPFQLLVQNGRLLWYENYAQGDNGKNGQQPHTGWVGTDIMAIGDFYRKSHHVRIVVKEGDGMLNQTAFVELLVDGVRKYYRNDGRIGEKWKQYQGSGVWQSDYMKFCTLYDFNNAIVDYSNTVRNRKFALVTEHFAQYQMSYSDYQSWQNPNTYYVSFSSGNDNNDGKTEITAWKTLTKVNATTFSAGDRVLFKRGDTWYGGLTISQSGTLLNPIFFGAYGTGEKPKITGFTEVTSWTNLGNNIWESTTAVSTLPKLNLLTVNGKNSRMGRWPNEDIGYYVYRKGLGTTGLVSNKLNSADTNWTGAEVVLRKVNWVIDRALITRHNIDTLIYEEVSTFDGLDNYGFFIQNDPRTLDVQDEWYYNPTTKKVRMYSTYQPVNVKVTTVENLITTGYYSANYIHLDNLSLEGANTYCIYVGGAITVTNCDLNFSGVDGIHTRIGGRAAIFNIIGNTINNTNNTGINYYLSGDNVSEVKYNIVKNNGLIVGVGGSGNTETIGIRMAGNSTSVISKNRVDSCGYVGISYGKGKATHNYVTNYCFNKQDGGAIYNYYAPDGTHMDSNVVAHGHGDRRGIGEVGSGNMVYGLYYDGLTTGVYAIGNTIFDVTGFGFKFNDPRNPTVIGNKIIGVTDAPISLSPRTQPLDGAYMRGNIWAIGNTSLTAAYRTSIRYPTDNTNFGNIDSNYFIMANPGQFYTEEIAMTPWSKTSYSYSTWQSVNGNDRHSTLILKEMKDVRLEINPSDTAKTIPLPGRYVDVKGGVYEGSITLSPWETSLLILDGRVVRPYVEFRRTKFINKAVQN